MSATEKRLLIGTAVAIVVLLLVLLYLVANPQSSGGGGVTNINFDLPDLGVADLSPGDGESIIDDPGLWEALPGLLEDEIPR